MLGLRDGPFEGNTAIPAGFGLNNAGFSFTNASLRALSLGGHSSAFTPINSLDDDQETNYAEHIAQAPVAAGAIELTDTVTIHTYQYGIGGFADVHLGYRGVPGDPVAIKALRCPAQQAVQQVQEECRLQMLCAHENVARVFGWKRVTAFGRPLQVYLVMEQCICSLSSVLQELYKQQLSTQQHPDAHPCQEPLQQHHSPSHSLHECVAYLSGRLRILKGVAAAVEHMHESCRVLHNDLRADNVLLSRVDGHFAVKLTDFGLAIRCGSEEELKGATETPGNPLWLAPEVCWQVGSPPYRVSASTDAFSFGHLMWEVLSGRSPYVDSWPGLEKPDDGPLMLGFLEGFVQGHLHQPLMQFPTKLPLWCPQFGRQFPQQVAGTLGDLFNRCCSFDASQVPISQQQRPSAQELHATLTGLAEAAVAAAAAVGVPEAAAAAGAPAVGQAAAAAAGPVAGPVTPAGDLPGSDSAAPPAAHGQGSPFSIAAARAGSANAVPWPQHEGCADQEGLLPSSSSHCSCPAAIGGADPAGLTQQPGQQDCSCAPHTLADALSALSVGNQTPSGKQPLGCDAQCGKVAGRSFRPLGMQDTAHAELAEARAGMSPVDHCNSTGNSRPIALLLNDSAACMHNSPAYGLAKGQEQQPGVLGQHGEAQSGVAVGL